jgi:hypothetical protein
MKTTVYLRVAKGPRGAKFAASTKPNQRPLTSGGWNETHLPTVAFALRLNIPDEAFDEAGRVVAEIDVPPDQLSIAAEVVPRDEIEIEHRHEKRP